MKAPYLRTWFRFGWTTCDDVAHTLVVYGDDGSAIYWRRLFYGLFWRVSCSRR